MKNKAISLLKYALLTVTLLAMVARVEAQTTFFSDNFNRANSTNLDDSTNGMGGTLITSGALTPGGIWEVPVDFAKGNGSNAMIIGDQLRMGGWGNTVYVFPNFNLATLVTTAVVSVSVTFTNNGPTGSSSGTDYYDRYVGVGAGFSLANGNAGGGTDRWIQNNADLFVEETEKGYILIYDGTAADRSAGQNFNLAVPLNGSAGVYYPGTLRIDLMVDNTTEGGSVPYNVLWNGGGGFTNVATGRTFAWSGNNAFCVGMEDRSAAAVTNTSFTVSSNSYTPPSVGLTWRATANNTWDTTSIDWVDTPSGLTNYAFYPGANVTFNDITTNATVNVPGPVAPGNIAISTVNSNYVFSGAGSIGGSGSLTMSGSSTLTLSLSNGFSGGATLSSGHTLVGNNYALGSGPVTLSGGTLASVGSGALTLGNAVTISSSTTLGDPINNGVITLTNVVNFNGTAHTLTINSPTVFAGGAMNGDISSKVGPGTLTINGVVNVTGSQDTQNGTTIYSGATVNSSDRIIADAGAFNGIARLVITNGTVLTNFATVGNLRSGRTISTGTNYVDLAGLYTLPAADAVDGLVTLQGSAAYSQMTFWPGGDFTARGVTNAGGVGNTVFIFNGGILRARNNTLNFFEGLAQTLVASGGANLDDGGFAITINQNFLDGGGGGLNKIGAGILTLNGANTYTGNTVVSNGTLNITGSLLGTGPVTVMSSGILAGSGTVAGAVSVQPGGALSPGAASGTPATLFLQNNLTLAGNLLIDINKSLTLSNDVINVSGTLTNTGTGTITFALTGPDFVSGDAFQLFNKPLLNGGAISISPATPGLGLAWSNNLAVNGTIVVIGNGPGGNPANLTNLVVSTPSATYPLTPAFASNIVSYSTSIAYSNSSVTVTPYSLDPSATIRVIYQGVTNVTSSGVASSPVSLKPGANLIDVNVTSPDGPTVEDYYVNVTRIMPNIIVILEDDQGFCDWSCYGSEIKTPNLDSLAATGLRFRNFYNAARCSPTRDAINTGLYTQQCAVDPTASLPPLRTDNNVTMAEILGAHGYHTYMAGKWHMGNSTGQLPWQRGYEEVFTYASGTADMEDEWTPSAYQFQSNDGETTNISYTIGTFYQPDAIGDYCLQFMGNQFLRHTNQPFFMYVPFGTAHFDIQAPQAWADTNVSLYTNGWEVVRYQRYTNMLAKGVIDPRYALSPNEGAPTSGSIGGPGVAIPAWCNLDTNRQADLVRRMSVYAAMIQKMDLNVGRIVQYLQQNGQFDNTLIFALSDNGGNYEGGVYGSTGGVEGAPPLTGANLENMGLYNQPAIYLGGGWAHVSNTPFRLFKHFDHFGGIGTPLIVHWPQGLTRTNQWENERGHIVDVMATVLDVTGLPYPTHWTNSVIGTNYPVLPYVGSSLAPLFTSTNATMPRNIGEEHEGNRAYISGNWKFVTKNFSLYDGSSFANELELYNLTNDPSEMTNLAYVDLQELSLMVTNWNNWWNFVVADQPGNFSSLLVTSYSNSPEPVYPMLHPAPLPSDLFVDSFERPENTNISANATAMSGSDVTSIQVPPIGVNAAYYGGYAGSGLSTAIEIVSNALWMAVGGGTAESGIQCNFDGTNITSAGGFSVELNVQNINDNGSDPANKYAGFGVGLTQAQAIGGNDISKPGSFRGEVGNPGAAACFVDLNYNGNVELWTNGILCNTVSVGDNNGVLTASFATTSFATNSPVTVDVFFNGTLVNINPAGTNTPGVSFYWNTNNNNYIGLSARATNYAQMNNLAIRTLPLANDLVVNYAMSYGLAGANAAPTADPDGDGVSNFGEWAFGGNPTLPDAYIAGFQGIQVMPGNNFIFEFQRYRYYASVGLSYHYLVSTDLVNWTETTPNFLGTDVNEDKTDYEVVTLSLPNSVTTGQNKLFLRIMAESN